MHFKKTRVLAADIQTEVVSSCDAGEADKKKEEEEQQSGCDL